MTCNGEKHTVSNIKLPMKGGVFQPRGVIVPTAFAELCTGTRSVHFLHYVPYRFDKWISNIVDSAISTESYPAVLCVGKHAQLSKHYRSCPLAT